MRHLRSKHSAEGKRFFHVLHLLNVGESCMECFHISLNAQAVGTTMCPSAASGVSSISTGSASKSSHWSAKNVPPLPAAVGLSFRPLFDLRRHLHRALQGRVRLPAHPQPKEGTCRRGNSLTNLIGVRQHSRLSPRCSPTAWQQLPRSPARPPGCTRSAGPGAHPAVHLPSPAQRSGYPGPPALEVPSPCTNGQSTLSQRTDAWAQAAPACRRQA